MNMAKDENLKLNKLPLGAIKPSGWLKRQLELQVSFIKKYPLLNTDFTDASEWQGGGRGEAWDKGPRFAASLVALASVTDDAELSALAEKWVGWIMSSVREDGNFGPTSHDDFLPRIEALTALLMYYEWKKAPQVLAILKKYFKYQFNEMDNVPCILHTRARLLDEVDALQTLYDASGDIYLRDLAERLRMRATDWFLLFSSFHYRRPTATVISKYAVSKKLKYEYRRIQKQSTGYGDTLKPTPAKDVEARSSSRYSRVFVETNGINISKALKYPATYGYFLGDPELKTYSLKALGSLLKYHGNAVGMFNNDNQLAGTEAASGVSTESLAEIVDSYASLLRHTADMRFADLMETVAFNAIPAAVNDDCSAIADIQQVNQIQISRKKAEFFNHRINGNMFSGNTITDGGLTYHRALPRVLENSCMTDANTIYFNVYLPSVINLKLPDTELTIREETDYPFRNQITFVFEKVVGEPDIIVKFRVPKYTQARLMVGDKILAEQSEGVIALRLLVSDGDSLTLKLSIPLTVLNNPDGSVSFRKGSLVMVSKIAGKVRLEGERPFCNYDVRPESTWQYAPIVVKGAVQTVGTSVYPVAEQPFNHLAPPFEIRVKTRTIKNWKTDDEGFSVVPRRASFSEEVVERLLVPYGATYLRIAQYPYCPR